MTKVCTKCKAEQDIDCFCNDKNSKDGKARWCRDCYRESYRIHREERSKQTKEYRMDHLEQEKSNHHNYYLKNKFTVDEKNKLYAKANSEQINAASRIYYATHKEQVKESKRKWRVSHPKESNEITRRARSKPGVIAKQNHARRARIENCTGSFSESEWMELIDKYEHKCLCCGRSDVNLTVDHVVPVSVGGTNSIDNLQPLCLSCNSIKHTKIIDYRGQYGK